MDQIEYIKLLTFVKEYLDLPRVVILTLSKPSFETFFLRPEEIRCDLVTVRDRQSINKGAPFFIVHVISEKVILNFVWLSGGFFLKN